MYRLFSNVKILSNFTSYWFSLHHKSTVFNVRKVGLRLTGINKGFQSEKDLKNNIPFTGPGSVLFILGSPEQENQL